MVRVSGMSSGLFSIQGSGMCQKVNTVALAAANAASASVSRGGSAVAAISAGASTRIRNGLSMPPVRNRSASSSAIISASRPAACFGSSRRIGLKAICSTMLTVAENAMTDQARDQRQVEIEALLDHEDGRELPQHGEPAQPQDRVQPHMRARFAKVGGSVVGHLRAILPFGP